MRTLIVDDEPTSQVLLRSMLADFGECQTLAEPSLAVAAIEKGYDEGAPFTLVCLDIVIPGASGHEILRQIRELEARRGILGLEGVKVIMISSLSDKRSVLQAFRDGCEGYVVKPVDRRRLLETVRSLTSGLPEVSNDQRAPSRAAETVTLAEEVKLFLVESYELLEQVEQEALKVEQAQHSSESVNAVFRAIHTVKGNSGFLGFQQLEQACHHGETLLDKMRAGVSAMDRPRAEAILALVDVLRRALRQIESGGDDSVPEVSRVMQELQRLSADGR